MQKLHAFMILIFLMLHHNLVLTHYIGSEIATHRDIHMQMHRNERFIEQSKEMYHKRTMFLQRKKA